MTMTEARTLTQATRLVQAGLAVQAAGVGGRLEVRVGGDGVWCLHYGRAGEVLCRGETRSKLAVYDWLREWFPRLKRQAGRGQHRWRYPARPLVPRTLGIQDGRGR